MQFLDDFYSIDEDGYIVISDLQGSNFAKQIAGDFNPIHDVGIKRFCVPGDLLFAIALRQYGLYQTMSFDFLDLVRSGSQLIYPDFLGKSRTLISYTNTKEVLGIEAGGKLIPNAIAGERLLRQYVAFSGQNFPHILLPLMQQNGVMINPSRPLVIYQNMSFELDDSVFDSSFDNLQIKLDDTSLLVDGKRGDAILRFSFSDDRGRVGGGEKKLVLSGLRPFEANAMQKLCDDYLTVAKAGA